MASARRLHLALALADAARETALQAALEAEGQTVARCLSAGELLGRLRAGGVDAVLVASDLYQLTAERRQELGTLGVPLVLCADAAEAGGWPPDTTLVGRDADSEEFQRALLAAAAGSGFQAPRPVAAAPSPPPADPAPVAGAAGHVFAVGGPPGAGRTLVAATLALALQTVTSVALVDVDLACSCTAPVLDADVERNLATLAHADPRDGGAWDRALAREGQPLHPRCPQPHGLLLCAPGTPEQRAVLSLAFFERLLGELRRRYAYVFLDVGAEVVSPDFAIHRAALQQADDVLLVVRADPLGLWHARATLGVWERQLRLPAQRLHVILNQYERRRQQPPAQVARALGVPLAAVLPADQAAIERTLLRHEPLLAARSSRLTAALLELADRLSGGQLVLPEGPARPAGRLARLRARLARRPVGGRGGRERHADGAGAPA